ncbi:Bug family tripartite tricarboxylate transporter substrate binding protein [Comamonas thiooxydans]|uniref:Bug family tripartite tricarboxylate transporter substrate binding protein n=1 Tax=Comamonas thiooxydans TaxID=363952 RepID=UPI000551C891|nr:tripartite tricarboxylate transporter substrate binding protein [Comamonas thiooxydans]
MTLWNRRAFSLTALTMALGCGSLAAAPAFPEAQRPIRVVVPFSPGGGVDGQARVVAQKLGEILGTTVVVDNRPGAGTLVAAQEVIKAAPNGYTLFYAASSTFAQNPHTMKAATYDPQKDFTPLSLGGAGPLVLVVNATLPVHSVKELVRYAKSQPGGISYASFGTGTSAHVFGQVFAQQQGLDLVHIPYRGGADMAADLMTGRVQMAFDAAPAALQNAATGKVRIIGVAAPQRTALLPGVPTLAEQGLKNMDLTSWLGWFGPAKLPPEIVKALNSALVKAIADGKVQEFYRNGAYTAESSTPEHLASMVRDSYERWGSLVKQAGIPKQ